MRPVEFESVGWPRCAVVIRTLNEARYLGALLDMIGRQSYPPACREVVVVDSGSSDETVAMAERAGCRIVFIDRENFSFGRSLNLGCDAAERADILVFVSGHCVPVSTQWLTELIRPFRQAAVAVTYGRQVGGPATKFSEHMLFEKYFPAKDGGDHQVAYFCNNANAAFRREAWASHRFDETLTGLEDMHLAQRCVAQGGLVVYAPGAAVFHYHHEKWPQVKRRYEREAVALQTIMPEVQVHAIDAMRYFLAGVWGDWRRAAAQACLLRNFVPIVAFRFCQYYGAWRGNHVHRKLSRRQKDRYFYPN